MDIACPKCYATYRIDLELSDAPKGFKCGACEHVFGLKRKREDGAEPPAPPKRVTGEISPELKRMAEEEAQLREKRRMEAQPPAEDQAPAKTQEAAPQKEPTPAEPQPKPDRDPKPETPDDATPAQGAADGAAEAPPETASDAETSSTPSNEEVVAFEAALGDDLPPPIEPEAEPSIAEAEASGDQPTDEGNAGDASVAKPRLGVLGVIFWSALVLGGVVALLNHFAADLAAAWPALAEPLAAFQADIATLIDWVQTQWTHAMAAISDRIPSEKA